MAFCKRCKLETKDEDMRAGGVCRFHEIDDASSAPDVDVWEPPTSCVPSSTTDFDGPGMTARLDDWMRDCDRPDPARFEVGDIVYNSLGQMRVVNRSDVHNAACMVYYPDNPRQYEYIGWSGLTKAAPASMR